MNWEDLLEKAAGWSKWLLLGYCVGHTLTTLGSVPIFNIVMIGVASGVVVADWINRSRA